MMAEKKQINKIPEGAFKHKHKKSTGITSVNPKQLNNLTTVLKGLIYD